MLSLLPTIAAPTFPLFGHKYISLHKHSDEQTNRIALFQSLPSCCFTSTSSPAHLVTLFHHTFVSCCSGSLVPDANDVELSGSSYDTTSNNWNQGRPGDIPPVPTGKNATYFVSLDNVPSGRHRMIIYAHNGVGWSQALKDPSLVVQVVNQGSMTRTSTFTFLVSSFLLSGLLTILWNNH